MLVLGPEEIRALAPMPRLIDCLQQVFRGGCVAPLRQLAKMPGGCSERLFVSMPAFHPDGSTIIKVVTVCPDNSTTKGLPTIQAAVLLFSEKGTPTALLDGTTITHLRTGAASALASRYLSREDSTHHVVIGTGALAPVLAEAHCAVRPITRITVWGRRPERARATAATIRSRVSAHIEVHVAKSVEQEIPTADIVSCATSSSAPVLLGKWLKSGAFVDLVGGFSPSKREADDDVIMRARIFVDTFEGALAEAGDLIDPLARGVISRNRIEGELPDLVCGRVAGRATGSEIIVFKSVGTAIEDLAASKFVVAAASCR